MKFEHFTLFAAAMIDEAAQCSIDNDDATELNVVKDIADAMFKAAQLNSDEQVLSNLANEIGMYESIEAYADDADFGALHVAALNYVA